MNARFIVLTLFPDMINGGLRHSVLKRAMDAGVIGVETVDIRDFADNKHRQADDYPYGGGCGMVMTPAPVYNAHAKAVEMAQESPLPVRTLYLTPRGKPFTQAMARELAEGHTLILLCGHYEGIDERAISLINPEEVSLGDFVLTGGELPAMAVIDAVARLVPGVLHNDGSVLDESFSGNMLEYPQYTRPPEFMGLSVPPVLLSGHHENVEAWRREKAREITAARRPDLLREKTMENYIIDGLDFVRPTLEMKEAALAFKDEFIRENSRMNGSNNFLKHETYEDWLNTLDLSEKGQGPTGLASSTLFCVNRGTGEIIGVSDIRHALISDFNHLPSYVNGHLGGSIRPSLRGKGYGAAMLVLSLYKAAEYGNERVQISCDKWNTASEHVIVKCGGVFENEVIEQNGNVIRRYHIDVAKA